MLKILLSNGQSWGRRRGLDRRCSTGQVQVDQRSSLMPNQCVVLNLMVRSAEDTDEPRMVIAVDFATPV